MYLDTCILVKLLVREPDSEACASTAAGSHLVSSELVCAEVASALLQKERSGHISKFQREASWKEFERQIQQQTLVLADLDSAIVHQAQGLMVQVHPRVALRTLDALHLATYLSVIPGPLFTKDKRMLEAAGLLGIPLVT